MEHLSLLWLTPAMDGLFLGGASDRRRFFDRMVMALHPTHGRTANRFEQAMRARNKMFDEGVNDPVWFEGVEAQMAEAGAALQSARLATLALLKTAIEDARDAVSAFPHALLDLAGFEGGTMRPTIARCSPKVGARPRRRAYAPRPAPGGSSRAPRSEGCGGQARLDR
jgi:DNA replication and repair protein RecF